MALHGSSGRRRRITGGCGRRWLLGSSRHHRADIRRGVDDRHRFCSTQRWTTQSQPIWESLDFASQESRGASWQSRQKVQARSSRGMNGEDQCPVSSLGARACAGCRMWESTAPFKVDLQLSSFFGRFSFDCSPQIRSMDSWNWVFLLRRKD